MVSWYIQLSWRDFYSFPFYCFTQFLCIVHITLSFSPCYSLELCIQLGISFLFSFPSFPFCFSSQLFVRPPQITTLPSCISFSWWWFWSPPPAQYSKPPSIVLQAVCLPDLIPWIYLLLLLYNHKRFGLFRSYLNGLVAFPNFFNLNLNFAIRSSWSEPQSAPGLVFTDCIELLHLQLQRI